MGADQNQSGMKPRLGTERRATLGRSGPRERPGGLAGEEGAPGLPRSVGNAGGSGLSPCVSLHTPHPASMPPATSDTTLYT